MFHAACLYLHLMNICLYKT